MKRKPTTRKRTTAAKKRTVKKVHKPLYKRGEFVYSPNSKVEKRQINEVKSFKTPGLRPKYRLIICDAKGQPKLSGWIDERALSKRKK